MFGWFGSARMAPSINDWLPGKGWFAGAPPMANQVGVRTVPASLLWKRLIPFEAFLSVATQSEYVARELAVSDNKIRSAPATAVGSGFAAGPSISIQAAPWLPDDR